MATPLTRKSGRCRSAPPRYTYPMLPEIHLDLAAFWETVEEDLA